MSSFSVTDNLAKSLSLIDSPHLGVGYLFEDSISISDAITISLGRLIDVSDFIVLSDLLDVLLPATRTASDSLLLTDSTLLNLPFAAAFSDNFVLTDLAVSILGLRLQETENLTWSDQIGTFNAFGLRVSDLLDFEDAAVILLRKHHKIPLYHLQRGLSGVI